MEFKFKRDLVFHTSLHEEVFLDRFHSQIKVFNTSPENRVDRPRYSATIDGNNFQISPIERLFDFSSGTKNFVEIKGTYETLEEGVKVKIRISPSFFAIASVIGIGGFLLLVLHESIEGLLIAGFITIAMMLLPFVMVAQATEVLKNDFILFFKNKTATDSQQRLSDNGQA